MNNKYTAMDVANYIIYFSNSKLGKSITNLQLQKFLYFSYVNHLKAKGSRLFDDVIEKWQYGPVVPSTYHAFKDYGFFSITEPKVEFDLTFIDGNLQLNEKKFNPSLIECDFEVRKQIELAVREWIDEPPFKMVEFTHKQPMWKNFEKEIMRGDKNLQYGDGEILAYYQSTVSDLPF